MEKGVKGKNFSANNMGQRKKSDFYETPYSITQHLLNVEQFDTDKIVCEPACGENAIVEVLKRKWDSQKIVAYDKEKDFLKDTQTYDYIITNPPFSIAHEFIVQAKKITKEKFAFLLPLSYLHGKKRYDEIYTDKDFPLKEVFIFTRYPMLGDDLREDGKYRTGMMVYAWYVYDRKHIGKPVISWIDNNADVLSKKDNVS